MQHVVTTLHHMKPKIDSGEYSCENFHGKLMFDILARVFMLRLFVKAQIVLFLLWSYVQAAGITLYRRFMDIADVHYT